MDGKAPQELPAGLWAQAMDLRTTFPRSPRETLGGFVLAARAVDKCRASLCGVNGEYNFNCPLDKMFFRFAGLAGEDFKAVVATGATDGDIETWIVAHTTQHSRDTIAAWNQETGPSFRHLDLEEGRI